MGFEAKILADTVNPDGLRLTTMCVKYPLIIHGEMLTHRRFSRNAESNRAIPIAKLIERVRTEPFVPIHWGANQKGMQAYEELDGIHADECKALWLQSAKHSTDTVELMASHNLHKQIGNRLLMPFQWTTVIISATDWENFFHLRCHHDAEPHIRTIATMMRDIYDRGYPKLCRWGDWHLPLTGFHGDQDLAIADLCKVSAARCARVSYLTHEGKRDVKADIELHDRLVESGHWSPFEHVAQAVSPEIGDWGNFDPGWLQYRKFFSQEHVKERVR